MAKKVEYLKLHRFLYGNIIRIISNNEESIGDISSPELCYIEFLRFAGPAFKCRKAKELKLKRTLLKNGFKLEVVK